MDTAAFRRGVRDVAPLLLGIIPFGLVAGIATVNAGLGLPTAVGLSVVVFAGASQLAALELLGQNAPLTVVVATAVVINLRLLMYSASIAPYFREFTGRWKAVLAYVLTDQAYALSVASYRSDRETNRKWYYLGVALTLWGVWQVTTIAGALLGTGVPDAWGLEFAIPLVFLAILVPAIEDAATGVAAVVGGTVAVVGAGLPLNLGLLVAAGVGITAGVLTESAVGGTDGD
ncbi:branched-chain amino acid ABC transporter permease [Haloarcula sp. CBA1130]|uniref:AzlC family ABC transporter permease n=1 Tax=unclassified Haloarcula TaxID=2624677 RepID=UPI0012444CF0|nr:MULTISPECIES: AzlC family ABC transporter permease [unclassified Haloarcula]KAA9396768.1 branched-chain amino acid ABC transporter permease [Haloarcula sp. CBA1129]KAA9401729.1 branched-chain amino acid ABC transporter permease [Haloarcula sp. CBA1130]